MVLVDKYRSLLKFELPPGHAFNRGAGSNMSALMDGMAEEPARIHDRVDDLLFETLPSTTTELISEWETAWGLPDQCTGALSTLDDRRAAILAKMIHVGQQSPGFFIRVAETLGYTIVVEENIDGSPYVWRILSDIITSSVYARAGSARAGDSIRTWGGGMLDCVMRSLNPAHLLLLFGYIEADVLPELMSATIWADGSTMALVFNQALSHGASYNNDDFSFDASLFGSDVAMAYVSGDGTATHIYTITGQILINETVTLDFTGDDQSLVRSGAYLSAITGFPVQNNSAQTEALPSIVSATIDSTGALLTLVFSEAMIQGTGYVSTDLNLDASIGGSDIGVTYVSGSGSDTWVLTIGAIIRAGETVNLDYNGRPDGIEDVSGNDLGAVDSLGVTNGSTEDYSDIVFWDGFEGIISNLVYTSTNYDYPAFHSDDFANASFFTMSSTIKRVGNKSMYVNIIAIGAYGLTFALPEPIDRKRCRLGFWGRGTGLTTGIWAMLLDSNDAQNYTYIGRYNAASMRVLNAVKLISGSHAYDPANSYPSIVSDNVWHFYELILDNAGVGFKVRCDGVDTSIISAATQDWAGSFDTIRIGNGIVTQTSQFYIDNMMVSTDPNRDLYALASLEYSPRV